MFIKYFIVACVTLNFYSNLSIANEHGGEHEAAAGHESGGHGEGHGEGHGDGHGETKPAEQPWREVETKISGLDAKVKAKQAEIVKMLEEKQHYDEKSPRQKELMDSITKEHRELRAAAEELEKQKTILKYRFPERGADPNRKYEKVEIKSIKELESSIGLDGKLNKAYIRAKKQYGRANHQESEKAHQKHLTTEKNESHESAPEKKTDPYGSVILQK